MQIAALCHVIARRFSSLNGDTALLAGLMHNVGRIYILTRASKFPTLTADPLTFNSIVRDWHANVAKALLENWKVAEEIVDAVAGSRRYGSRGARSGDAHRRAVAGDAARRQSQRREMNVPDETLLKGLKRMQLQVRDCHTVLDESAEEIAALKSALGG